MTDINISKKFEKLKEISEDLDHDINMLEKRIRNILELDVEIFKYNITVNEKLFVRCKDNSLLDEDLDRIKADLRQQNMVLEEINIDDCFLELKFVPVGTKENDK